MLCLCISSVILALSFSKCLSRIVIHSDAGDAFLFLIKYSNSIIVKSLFLLNRHSQISLLTLVDICEFLSCFLAILLIHSLFIVLCNSLTSYISPI